MLEKDNHLANDWLKVARECEHAVVNSVWNQWWRRGALRLHSLLYGEFQKEVKSVAEFLCVDFHALLCGQLVYDVSTTTDVGIVCGCTSMAVKSSGGAWHGRLLDWNWPRSIVGRVRLIDVKTDLGQFTAEHIPGATGFTGAFNKHFAINLNQAPRSKLRSMALPALWWFRKAIVENKFSDLRRPPRGGMTDALIHHTTRDVTSRIYYTDGKPEVRTERLTSTPVVLTNSYRKKGIKEGAGSYDWSMYREAAILNSRKRDYCQRLHEAACADSIHMWEAELV